MGIIDGLTNIQNNLSSTILQSPVKAAAATAIGGVVAGGLVGTAVGAAVTKKRKKSSMSRVSRKRNSRIKHTKRGWKQDRKRRSKQKWEVAYQKRKKKHSSKSGKKRGKHIYYAKKTGQPYILKANGQAKFIKGKRRKK